MSDFCFLREFLWSFLSMDSTVLLQATLNSVCPMQTITRQGSHHVQEVERLFSICLTVKEQSCFVCVWINIRWVNLLRFFNWSRSDKDSLHDKSHLDDKSQIPRKAAKLLYLGCQSTRLRVTSLFIFFPSGPSVPVASNEDLWMCEQDSEETPQFCHFDKLNSRMQQTTSSLCRFTDFNFAKDVTS